MTRSAREVALVPRTDVGGLWERHVSERYESKAMQGSTAGGRWGPVGGFPVIYLGRPIASVIVEAYRHLVDPFDGMRPEFIRPRVLVRCELAVTNLLDLRSTRSRLIVGLTDADIHSDIDDYASCVEVGSIAHQLGCHGVIAPSAAGLGETLALFPTHLPLKELPVVVATERWDRLPADPREHRVVEESDESG